MLIACQALGGPIPAEKVNEVCFGVRCRFIIWHKQKHDILSGIGQYYLSLNAVEMALSKVGKPRRSCLFIIGDMV